MDGARWRGGGVPVQPGDRSFHRRALYVGETYVRRNLVPRGTAVCVLGVGCTEKTPGIFPAFFVWRILRRPKAWIGIQRNEEKITESRRSLILRLRRVPRSNRQGPRSV